MGKSGRGRAGSARNAVKHTPLAKAIAASPVRGKVILKQNELSVFFDGG
jgi:hypothetical protein